MGGIRSLEYYVPTLTLDKLLESFEPPTFVKIDVEGAEALVFEGASKLIESIRPRFYFEVREELSDEIFKTFADAKYTAYDQDGNVLSARCANNPLFVPE